MEIVSAKAIVTDWLRGKATPPAAHADTVPPTESDKGSLSNVMELIASFPTDSNYLTDMNMNFFSVVIGLALFGVVCAINSSVHSYLILSFSDSDKVALNVGFYYMANAGGRLVGCLLSGLSYQLWGLTGCLATTSAMLLVAGAITIVLAGEQQGEAAAKA